MDSEILFFRNLNEKTAYNPTIPFEFNGKEYIGVRVEPIDKELDSEILFAYKDKNEWVVDFSLPSFPLQDPAIMKIRNKVFLAGVSTKNNGKRLDWRTDFYYGSHIDKLKKLISGPWGMKDVRLIGLGSKIGVFTKPYGKIAYTEISSLKELKKLNWYSANVLHGLFKKNEWGGVNQVINLSKGLVGIIGHVAYLTYNGNKIQKHYYAMSFVFDTKNKQYFDYKIIAKRKDFPPSLSKRKIELDDVVFPAGITNIHNHHVELYVGLSDFCSARKIIPNPFIDYL